MNKHPEEIEDIFRNSNSPDELFDTFRRAITHKIADIDLYKILLANPILSGEELKMYTEHLSKIFSDKAFDLFMWTGSIFANHTSEFERLEDSISYFVKALYSHPKNHEPYCRLLQLYNLDMNLPTNKIILDIVEECANQIEKKSIVYTELGKLYEKLGKRDKAVECHQMALKYFKEGN
jgi:tetratricopeptide (TPR) repeat protein